MVTFKQVLSLSYDYMSTHCTQIEMQFSNGITQFINFFIYLEKYTAFIKLPYYYNLICKLGIK